MKIIMTGSTGFIGSALVSWFAKQNYELTRLIRSASFYDHRYPSVQWDPIKRQCDPTTLENHDVVIHLAGENVAKKRWSEAQKQKIKDSRVLGTTFLCEMLGNLQHRPKLLLSASAAGYYGNRNPHEPLTEESEGGTGFLASVVRQWEKATEPAQASGIRVVHMRFGMVLGSQGGALARMLPIFKLGLGGPIGSGRQAISWIALDEIPKMIYHIIQNETIRGPVNFTAPLPVTNKAFARQLGKALERPAFLPLPAFAARLMFGEMAEELLLGGATILPKKLQDSGYKFLHPDLESAFRAIFAQPY